MAVETVSMTRVINKWVNAKSDELDIDWEILDVDLWSIRAGNCPMHSVTVCNYTLAYTFPFDWLTPISSSLDAASPELAVTWTELSFLCIWLTYMPLHIAYKNTKIVAESPPLR